jgi:hypothetical protein
MTGVRNIKIGRTLSTVFGRSRYRAARIPKIRHNHPRFAITKRNPGIAMRAEIFVCAPLSHNAAGNITRLWANNRVFLQMVRATYVKSGAEVCLIISDCEINAWQESLIIDAHKLHVMIPAAKYGAYSLIGIENMGPITMQIVRTRDAVLNTIQNGPNKDRR